MSLNVQLSRRITLDGLDPIIATRNLMKWINLGIGEDKNVALGHKSQVKFDKKNLVGYNVGIGYECLYYNSTSQFNVAIGYECLRGGTSEDGGTVDANLFTGSHSNVAIGYQCGQFLGSGAENNVLIGYRCGHSTISNKFTGNNNTYVGYQCGLVNIDGSENVGMGVDCLKKNTTGNQNVAIGKECLQSNVSGESNVAIGYQCLDKNQESFNTAIGYQSLFSNTFGNQSVAIGYQSLFSNISGNENVAIGYKSLFSNIGGKYNVAIGYQCLNENQASYNTAIGLRSSYWNSYGQYNVTIGYKCLEGGDANIYTDTNANVAIGYQCGLFVGTSAINNVLIGFECAKASTGAGKFVGDNNTYVGYQCGFVNTNGSENVAIGTNCLDSNTTGNQNVAIGKECLQSNVSGVSNVAIGYQCLKGIELYTSVNKNVVIGYQSGYNINNNIDNNVLIGYQTGYTYNQDQTITNLYVFYKLGNNNNGIINDIIGENNDDYLGYDISLNSDGTILAIGTKDFNRTRINTNTGNIKIYQYSPSESYWLQLGETIHGEQTDENLSSVKLNSDGNIIVTSSYNFDNDSTADTGKVMVFEYKLITESVWNNGNTSSFNLSDGSPIIATTSITYNANTKYWIQKGNALYGASGDKLGEKLQINNNGTIIALASQANNSNTGYVRIYEYDSSTDVWVLKTTVFGQTANKYFGRAISLIPNASILAVSTTDDHIKVYEFNTSNWSSIRTDTITGGNSSNTYVENFGSDIALNSDGTIIAIGANNYPSQNSYQFYSTQGGIYIKKYVSSSWTDIGFISGPVGYYHYFGTSVSINSTGTIVSGGAPQYFNNASPDTHKGFVKVFKYDNGTTWDEIGIIEGTTTNERFGYRLSSNEDSSIIAISSLNYDNNKGKVTIQKIMRRKYNAIENTLIGTQSGYDIIDGSKNVGIGFRNLYNNNFGQENVSIGNSSLFTNQSGTSNVSIGSNNMYSNTFGINNVSLGYKGNYSNTIGSNNVSIGRESMYSNTSGNLNIIVGYKSGYSNISGSENIGIGAENYYYNLDGNQNVALGNQCFKGIENFNSSNQNIAIGYQCAFNVGNFASNNILIGYQCGYSVEESEFNFTHISKQTGSDFLGTTDDEFGKSVSMNGSGNRVAIGIPKHDDGSNGNDCGIVRIYDYNSNTNTWTEVGTILGASTNDYFGHCVAISGDGIYIVIGAYNGLDTNTSTRKGYVKIYKYDSGTNWDLIGTIYGENTNDEFGYSVFINKNNLTPVTSDIIISVGAPKDDYTIDSVSYTDGGSVKVYKYAGSGTTWNQLGGTIYGEKTTEQSGFATALNDAGNVIAIGSPFKHFDVNEDNSYPADGGVRCYEYRLVTSTEWSSGNITNFLTTTGTPIIVSDGDTTLNSTKKYWIQKGNDLYSYEGNQSKTADSRFGWSLSFNGDGTILAVGAPLSGGYLESPQNFSYSKGAVHTYRFGGGDWYNNGIIHGEGDYFQMGGSISLNIDGSLLCAGTLDDNSDPVRSKKGRVVIFKYDTTYEIYIDVQSLYRYRNWKPIIKNIEGDNQYDSFGKSVSLNSIGDKFIVGSPDYPANGNDGIVRSYKTEDYKYRAIQNILIGNKSGYNIIDGGKNIGIGFENLYYNRHGIENIGIGEQALKTNVSGNYNIGIGYQCLFSNIVNLNTGIGYQCLYYNSTGQFNTAIGYKCLMGETDVYTGTNANVAIGYHCGLFVGSSATNNVLIGFECAKASNGAGEFVGVNNTFIGSQCGFVNKNGSENVAIGTNCLDSNIDGNQNVVIGEQAARGCKGTNSNNNGTGNIIIGRHAAYSASDYANSTTTNEQCYKNTIIGYAAQFNGTNFKHSTALGYSSSFTGSNQIRLGTSNENVLLGSGAAVTSDRRDKYDINNTSLGLNFILKLQSREYKMDYRDLYWEMQIKKDENGNNILDDTGKTIEEKVSVPYDGRHKRNRVHQGFIAQEIKDIIDELGIDFSGYKDNSVTSGDSDELSLNYSDFIGPIVKSIQEIHIDLSSEKIKTTTLETKVSTLETKVSTLETKVSSLETDLASIKIHLGI